MPQNPQNNWFGQTDPMAMAKALQIFYGIGNGYSNDYVDPSTPVAPPPDWRQPRAVLSAYTPPPQTTGHYETDQERAQKYIQHMQEYGWGVDILGNAARSGIAVRQALDARKYNEATAAALSGLVQSSTDVSVLGGGIDVLDVLGAPGTLQESYNQRIRSASPLAEAFYRGGTLAGGPQTGAAWRDHFIRTGESTPEFQFLASQYAPRPTRIGTPAPTSQPPNLSDPGMVFRGAERAQLDPRMAVEQPTAWTPVQRAANSALDWLTVNSAIFAGAGVGGAPEPAGPNLVPFEPSKIPFKTKSAQVKEAIDAGRVRKGKDTTTAYPPWVDKPGQFARYEATYGLKNLLDMLRRGRFVPEPTITPFTPAILTPPATPGTAPVGVPLPQPVKRPPTPPEPKPFGPQNFYSHPDDPAAKQVYFGAEWPPPAQWYGPSTTSTVTTTTPPLPPNLITGTTIGPNRTFISGTRDISRWSGDAAGQFAEPIRGTMHVLEPGHGVISFPDELRVPQTKTKTITERGPVNEYIPYKLNDLIRPNASIRDQLFHWHNDAETALAPHEDFLRSSLWGSIPTLLSEDAISTQTAVDRRRGILRNNTSGTEQWNADLAAAHTEAQQQQSEADRRASTNQPITWEHDLDILYQRNPRGKLPPAPAAEPASLPINTPEAMAKVKSPAEQAAEKVVRLGRRRPEGLRPTTAGALQLYNMFADMRGWDQNLDAVAGETYDPSAPIDIFGEPTYYKNDPSKSPAENKQLKLAFEEKQAEKFRQKDAFIDAIKSAQTIEIDNLGTLGKRVSFTTPSEDGKATTHTVDLTMAEHNDLMENVVAPSSNPNETRVGWTIASKDETTVRKEAAQEEEHAFLTERAPGTGATENDHSENAGRSSVFEEDKNLEREDPWNPLGPEANTYLGTRWNPISRKRERVELPTRAARESMGNPEEPYYRKTPIIDVVNGQDVEQTRINRQGKEVPSMRPIGQEPVWAETPKDAGQARKDRSWKRDRTTFGGTEVWDQFFLRDPDISPQDEARTFTGATSALRPEVKRILPQLVSLDKPPTAEMLPQLQYAMLTPEANKANAGYRKNINNNIDNFYQSLIRNGVDKRTALELSQKVRNAGSLSNALNVLTSTTTRQMSPISSNRQRTLVASAEPLPLRTIIDGMNAIGHGLSHGYTPGTDAMLSMTNKDGLPILGGYGATMDYTLPVQFTAGFGLGQKGGNKQPSGRLYFRLKPGTIPEDTPQAPTASQQQPQSTPKTTRRTTYTPKFDALPAYVEGQKSMVYAGIGSRETPPEVQEKMKAVAAYLAKAGYTLNSGHAKGADRAFEAGAGDSPKNIFFNTDATQLVRDIALEIHPTPQKIAGTSNLDLHARNTYQVFGKNLDSPVDFVIAWTPDGLESSEGRSIESGGTGQAIDMASRKGIPIINLANPDWESKLRAVLGLPQSQPAAQQQQPPGRTITSFNVVSKKSKADVSAMREGKHNLLNTPPGQPGWLGNPWRWSGNGGSKGATRKEVVEKYRKAFYEKAASDPAFAEAVRGLRGKNLYYYQGADGAEGSHVNVIHDWLEQDQASSAPLSLNRPRNPDRMERINTYLDRRLDNRPRHERNRTHDRWGRRIDEYGNLRPHPALEGRFASRAVREGRPDLDARMLYPDRPARPVGTYNHTTDNPYEGAPDPEQSVVGSRWGGIGTYSTKASHDEVSYGQYKKILAVNPSARFLHLDRPLPKNVRNAILNAYVDWRNGVDVESPDYHPDPHNFPSDPTPDITRDMLELERNASRTTADLLDQLLAGTRGRKESFGWSNPPEGEPELRSSGLGMNHAMQHFGEMQGFPLDIGHIASKLGYTGQMHVGGTHFGTGPHKVLVYTDKNAVKLVSDTTPESAIPKENDLANSAPRTREGAEAMVEKFHKPIAILNLLSKFKVDNPADLAKIAVSGPGPEVAAIKDAAIRALPEDFLKHFEDGANPTYMRHHRDPSMSKYDTALNVMITRFGQIYREHYRDYGTPGLDSTVPDAQNPNYDDQTNRLHFVADLDVGRHTILHHDPNVDILTTTVKSMAEHQLAVRVHRFSDLAFRGAKPTADGVEYDRDASARMVGIINDTNATVLQEIDKILAESATSAHHNQIMEQVTGALKWLNFNEKTIEQAMYAKAHGLTWNTARGREIITELKQQYSDASYVYGRLREALDFASRPGIDKRFVMGKLVVTDNTNPIPREAVDRIERAFDTASRVYYSGINSLTEALY